MAKTRLIQLLLLPALLGFALGDGGARGDALREGSAVEPIWRRIAEGVMEIEEQVAHIARDAILPRLEDRVVLAQVTPTSLSGNRPTAPADLKNRQENPVDVANRSAQQAIQSAEQSARQSIQQAQESARQASESARQAGEQASQRAQRAEQSASDGIRQAQESAANSASQQIRQNLESVTRSASSAIAQQVASASQNARISAESVIALAASSAQSIMDNAASMVNAAKAEGTAIKQDATIQVQQAQGTAISVTQTALIVVGAVIGSILLTVLVFYFILRYRRGKLRKRESLRKDIGYPQVTNDMESKPSWPTDFKVNRWPSTSSRGPSDPTPSKVGLATSYYDPPPQVATVPSSAQLLQAPAIGRPPPAKGAQFAGFPRRKEVPSRTDAGDEDDEKDGKPYLRRTQTVSPFGPIADGSWSQAGSVSSWPLDKREST